MKKGSIRLDEEEIQHTQEEGQNASQILQLKREWYMALETLGDYLMPGIRGIEKIIYDPSIWPAPLSQCLDTIRFSTPNKETSFDYFPTEQAKIGGCAHECGHRADYQQYGTDSFAYSSFVSEQRANLRAMHMSPQALYELIRQSIYSRFRVMGVDPNLGEYEEAFITIETLGGAGLQRRDNVVDFLKGLKEERGIPIDLFLGKSLFFTLTGLAVPPSLNYRSYETKYGIRTINDLRKISRKVGRYIRGEIKEPPKIVTCTDDGYIPEDSVDLSWVNRDKALEGLEKAIPHFDNKSENSRFRCFGDMHESLEKIRGRIISV